MKQASKPKKEDKLQNSTNEIEVCISKMHETGVKAQGMDLELELDERNRN